tara:strand:- start:880 stop:1068 length:189 start_codon:yes stop_codon:yes gene_type:complete
MDKEVIEAVNDSVERIRKVVHKAMEDNPNDVENNLANHGALIQIEMCVSSYFDFANKIHNDQ